MSVSGGSVTEATISGLTASTTYSIEVGAVTGEDRIGVYSTPILKRLIVSTLHVVAWTTTSYVWTHFHNRSIVCVC